MCVKTALTSPARKKRIAVSPKTAGEEVDLTKENKVLKIRVVNLQNKMRRLR